MCHLLALLATPHWNRAAAPALSRSAVLENAVYHVTARGNERKDIYRDPADRQRFLETLEEAVDRFGLVVHAYCLLGNHYHLLLQTPRANLTGALGWLQATYSIRFNRRHKRSGHLFQGRFKAHLVEADLYARQLVKYIHLNPVTRIPCFRPYCR